MAPKTVVIIGGGYCGLSAAVRLQKSRRFRVVLVDKHPAHLKVTHLHKTVHDSLSRYRYSYDLLASRFQFEFLQAEVHKDDLVPGKLARHRTIRLVTADGTEKELAFDYALLATGGVSAIAGAPEQGLFTEDELKNRSARSLLDDLASHKKIGHINVIGGGATAVQFVFELRDYLQNRSPDTRLSILNMDDQFMPSLPRRFHDYALQQFARHDIHWQTSVQYRYIEDGKLVCDDLQSGQKLYLPSQCAFLFPGITCHPARWLCDEYGMILTDTKNSCLFSGGDNSLYEGTGLNAQSAQAAVRKGKTIAENITRLDQGRSLVSYNYSELGYFVSFGSFDGVGWLLNRANVLTGPAAYVIKELIEKQFDFFLDGLDTYFI